MDKKIIYQMLHKTLSKKRYYHTICVAKECVKLAHWYQEDEEKAYLAGLLHDYTKELPLEKQLQILADHSIILDNVERRSPQILHAITGMIQATAVFHIQDQDILHAIRYHSTARADMSTLEKIVYLADCISEDRTFDYVNELRQYTYQALNYGLRFQLTNTIVYLTQRQRPLHNDTIQAYNQLVDELIEEI